MLVPSGRVHALGAGCLVVEVQQNSDTTYRVFDFNRPGLDGELRELHVPESLASIDWDDAEPGLLPRRDPLEVSSDHFRVVRRALDGPERVTAPGECAFVCVPGWRGGVRRADLLPRRRLPRARRGRAGAAVGPAGGRADVLVIELPELRRG
jgi:hypothetical protein